MIINLKSEQEISVTGAPAIPGLRFRSFQGESDYTGILDVILASMPVDQSDHYETLEDIRNNYSHPVNFDPYQDMLIAEIDGKVTAYCEVDWRREEPSHARLYSVMAMVAPNYRRQGLGHALLHFGEERARQIASGHPQDGERFFSVWARETETSKRALLEGAGYRIVRKFYKMVRPDLENIPDHPLPPGIEARPATPDHYRAVWNQMDEAFRDHWGHIPMTEGDYQRWQNSREFQPDLWQIAWAGEQVVGTVLGFINHEDNAALNEQTGWTEEITVRREYRGRGIAKALIARCLLALKERGMTQAALGVDTENLSGALHLYESMGYRPVRNGAIYRKPMG